MDGCGEIFERGRIGGHGNGSWVPLEFGSRCRGAADQLEHGQISGSQGLAEGAAKQTGSAGEQDLQRCVAHIAPMEIFSFLMNTIRRNPRLI